MSTLVTGSVAPAFSAVAVGGPYGDGTAVSLSDFAGKNVVLYFYPRDDTPGCTKQACGFRDEMGEFESAETVVLGVSTDTVESHEKFVEKYELTFPLLADEDHAVAEKYGVWVEKNLYGKKSMGIARTTFLIDKTGKIAAIWPKVKVDGHIREVIKQLESLG